MTYVAETPLLTVQEHDSLEVWKTHWETEAQKNKEAVIDKVRNNSESSGMV